MDWDEFETVLFHRNLGDGRQLSKLNVKSFVKLQLCSGEVSKTVEELFYNVHWNLDDFSLPATPTDVAN